MPQIELVAQIGTPGAGFVSQIGDLMIVDTGTANPVLISTTLYDGGFVTWETNGTVSEVETVLYNYNGNTNHGGVPVLTQVELAGGPALLASTEAGGGLVLYPVRDDGSLGAPVPLGTSSFGADLTNAITVELANGQQAIFAGLAGKDGIARLILDASGQVVTQNVYSDTAGTAAADVAGLAHLSAGGANYLVSACAVENAVTLWSINGNGGLTAQDTWGADEGLWITGATGLAAAEAHGVSYVVLAAGGSSSLSVFRLEGNGTLTQTDHLLDSLDTRFGSVATVTTIELDGRLYVIAGGGDDGISLFEMMPNGRLLARAHIEDTTAISLDNVSDIAATVSGDTIDIFVASSSEAGLTQLSYTPDAAGQTLFAAGSGSTLNGTGAADILTGAQGADRLSGGAGADVLLDGGGSDTLTGGAGADVFILSFDETQDRITDFELGVDRIDLSGWSMLRDISQLTLTQTATGMRIAYLGEVLVVESADGGPIDVSQLTNADLIDGYRVLSDYTDPFTIEPYVPEPEPEPDPGRDAPEPVPGAPPPPPLPEEGDPVGTAGPDTLTGDPDDSGVFGEGGNDILYGSDADDFLFGGAGDDQLFGGKGADYLHGGEGRDQMDGGRGSDTYLVDDPLDFVLGEESGGGHDTVLAWVDHTLSGYVEDLRLQGDADLNGTGNTRDNQLVGQAGNNVLSGMDGFDILTGKGGDDRLIGGAGCDWLVGDGGADVFVYGSANDSRPGQDVRDFINGFQHGVDLIDLSSLDANGRMSGNQAFIFIGGDDFSAAGQLRFHTWGNYDYGILEADQDGDGVADFQIFINGTDYMLASDIIL